jgi:hypothetical protein
MFGFLKKFVRKKDLLKGKENLYERFWELLQDLPAASRLSRQPFGPNDRMVLYTLSAEEESDPPHVLCTEVEESIWRVGGSDGGSPKVRSQ